MQRAGTGIITALVLLALGAAGCGEKEENLDVVPETEPGLETGPVVPKASEVQAGVAAAEQLARSTATARVAPNFKVAADAWTVTCKDPEGELVTCAVSAGLCSGSVLITPTKVPAGESAEDFAPKADSTRVRCKAPKKK
ncbi:hypothetical protein BH20ACT15_BH20ACT15_15220 [soil metagenome]